MAYLAIARKWRPHRFDDLVGQMHVVQTLKNAIAMNRVSHAYLFSGARGIGKTSVARIFAKALRCPNAKEANPCNECPECLAISDSRSVDVVEIDGASNNGVEAVRGIRENVVYGASSGTYKIYIIDEVHMLSISAFNALLKTLEEPPSHVIFVFATTEVQKIPLTILSRCQRFEFRRLSNKQIIDRLQHILTAEKVVMSEEGMRTIASHSDGSLRDSLSLLDQVLSYSGGQHQNIDDKQVVEALGVKDQAGIVGLLSDIVHKDVKSILSRIGESYMAGVDLKHLAERCLEELRLLYLVTLARDNKGSLTADELDISAGYFAKLNELAEKASLLQLERMAQIFGKTISQLGWSSLPRFVLELAAIRMTKLDDLERIEASLLSHQPLESATSAETPLQMPIMAPSTPPRLEPSRERELTPPAHMMSERQQQPSSSDPAQAWKGFVDAVMKKRPLLGALLCHAKFKMENTPQGKRITLAFGEGSFYEQQATDTKNRTEIEEMIKTFFGREAGLILSNGAGETLKSLETVHQEETAEIKKSTLENPTVLKMKELLGADIVDVNVEA